jgi:hypothetical protein
MDAFLVLSGALLTRFIEVSDPLEHMALDCILPQSF